ncbi:hypothetical protein H4582DRAFT_2065908 [Lactarius indigo]|nr:hypothetical protein H4582DRAFT_2065908 [Lactarius indigo]
MYLSYWLEDTEVQAYVVVNTWRYTCESKAIDSGGVERKGREGEGTTSGERKQQVTIQEDQDGVSWSSQDSLNTHSAGFQALLRVTKHLKLSTTTTSTSGARHQSAIVSYLLSYRRITVAVIATGTLTSLSLDDTNNIDRSDKSNGRYGNDGWTLGGQVYSWAAHTRRPFERALPSQLSKGAFLLMHRPTVSGLGSLYFTGLASKHSSSEDVPALPAQLAQRTICCTIWSSPPHLTHHPPIPTPS